MAARPMKTLLAIATVGVVGLAAWCEYRPGDTRSAIADPTTGDTLPVTIAGRKYKLELALDDISRYRGLSDRREIAADGGMLFAFRRAKPLSFVMRKCLVPIDLIYLDAEGRVGRMYEMQVEPYDTPDDELKDYESVEPAQFAIELKAGSIDKLQLKRGQKIDLPLDALKKRAQ